ncbi:MAG: hypothetical protein HY678_11870 [Chloroflexi bacterium]|nr:hypothetical protein [Chloroflexota bacterium]
MSVQEGQLQNVQETRQRTANKRLETTGWALFLIMLGGIGLAPDDLVPKGTWLIGTGLILLGLNVARYLSGIKVRGLSIVLGIVALLGGLGDLYAVGLPVLAILLILLGANLLVRLLFERAEPRSDVRP